MDSELLAQVTYRINKAKDTLSEAQAYADDVPLQDTVQAVYYAIQFAAQGLLQARRVHATRHDEVSDLFFKEFVETGLVGRELGFFYRQMLERQQEIENGPSPVFDKGLVGRWVEQAERFVSEIERVAGAIMEGTKT